MGSTKQHHRGQRGPGSLQYWSLLQATTGIKSQLHTSVKAKHCRPSAALPLLQGGTPAVSGNAPRHPNTAGFKSLVPGFSLSQLYCQSINKIPFNTSRGFFSHCSSSPATQGGTGSTRHPPASAQLHFLFMAPGRIPTCSRNKGRQWLAAPFCISCFPPQH